MLSAVITALLLVVMLLIVASFVFGAWRERKRHLQMLTAQTPEWSLFPPDRRVTAVLQLQDGTVVGVEEPTPSFASAWPRSWYSTRRTLVSAGLRLKILLAPFLQSGLADRTVHDLSDG